MPFIEYTLHLCEHCIKFRYVYNSNFLHSTIRNHNSVTDWKISECVSFDFLILFLFFQDCQVDDEGFYTDGIREELKGKNVLVDANETGMISIIIQTPCLVGVCDDTTFINTSITTYFKRIAYWGAHGLKVK